MADVNDIIAHGFGSWSTFNSIPTYGFGSTILLQRTITIDFATSLDGEVDGARKVIATLVPGDAGVVYEFEETELS